MRSSHTSITEDSLVSCIEDMRAHNVVVEVMANVMDGVVTESVHTED